MSLTPSDRPKLSPDTKYNLDWNDFYSYQDITDFMEELATTYEYVTVQSIGYSYEGRDMKVLQITKAGPGKPNVFIEGGKKLIFCLILKCSFLRVYIRYTCS